MSQLLSSPLHLNVSRKQTPFFSNDQTVFSLSTFSQRFGSSTPNEYFENKNHETQYSTVSDRVATLGSSKWCLLSTTFAQNVYSHYQFSNIVFNVNSENSMLESGTSKVHLMFKKYTLITGFLILFLMLTLRIWFFKVLTVKYIRCSNLYSHYLFCQFV